MDLGGGGPIRAVIADQSAADLARIVELLGGDAEIEVVAECSTGRAVVDAIEELEPELVVLDVAFPDIDAFEALGEVPEASIPLVVFVTADESSAVRAFEVRAVDYVVKPFSEGRLRDAWSRVKREARETRAPVPTPDDRLLDLVEQVSERLGRSAAPADGVRSTRFVVRKAQGRLLLVGRDEIRWVEAAGDYVRLHTREGSHLIRETMVHVEQKLGEGGFVRIHRSSIVSLEYVAEIKYEGDGRSQVQLADGTLLAASRSGWKRLQEAFGLGADDSSAGSVSVGSS